MLFLDIGVKVMLLENVWPEKGLVNGAMGVIDDIVWHGGRFYFSSFFTALFYIERLS